MAAPDQQCDLLSGFGQRRTAAERRSGYSASLADRHGAAGDRPVRRDARALLGGIRHATLGGIRHRQGEYETRADTAPLGLLSQFIQRQLRQLYPQRDLGVRRARNPRALRGTHAARLADRPRRADGGYLRGGLYRRAGERRVRRKRYPQAHRDRAHIHPRGMRYRKGDPHGDRRLRGGQDLYRGARHDSGSLPRRAVHVL